VNPVGPAPDEGGDRPGVPGIAQYGDQATPAFGQGRQVPHHPRGNLDCDDLSAVVVVRSADDVVDVADSPAARGSEVEAGGAGLREQF